MIRLRIDAESYPRIKELAPAPLRNLKTRNSIIFYAVLYISGFLMICVANIFISAVFICLLHNSATKARRARTHARTHTHTHTHTHTVLWMSGTNHNSIRAFKNLPRAEERCCVRAACLKTGNYRKFMSVAPMSHYVSKPSLREG